MRECRGKTQRQLSSGSGHVRVRKAGRSMGECWTLPPKKRSFPGIWQPPASGVNHVFPDWQHLEKGEDCLHCKTTPLKNKGQEMWFMGRMLCSERINQISSLSSASLRETQRRNGKWRPFLRVFSSCPLNVVNCSWPGWAQTCPTSHGGRLLRNGLFA